MTFWDPYGYIETKKFKIDNILYKRGFLYILAILAHSAPAANETSFLLAHELFNSRLKTLI